jgi:hypothetical protein
MSWCLVKHRFDNNGYYNASDDDFHATDDDMMMMVPTIRRLVIRHSVTTVISFDIFIFKTFNILLFPICVESKRPYTHGKAMKAVELNTTRLQVKASNHVFLQFTVVTWGGPRHSPSQHV